MEPAESVAYRNQLESLERAASAEAFERLMYACRSNTVGYVDDASEFFEGLKERLGDIQAARRMRWKRRSSHKP